MPWWQVSVSCEASELEQVESQLLEQGALSISISDARDEPIFEPLPGETPLWSHSIISGLFEGDHTAEALSQSLGSVLPDHLVSSLQCQRLEDKDWQISYQHHFSPIQVSSRLWIVPSWHQPPDPDAVNITLDPGMAFGTGGHATTALCLNWLGENNFDGFDVIDFGCGSGILGIAALKLGAAQVQAVDIDPQALMATRENCRINAIDENTITIAEPQQLKDRQVDLLMANILCQPLLDLRQQLTDLVKPGGKILLSGILKEQVETLQSAYQETFSLEPASTMDDWARLTGTREQ